MKPHFFYILIFFTILSAEKIFSQEVNEISLKEIIEASIAHSQEIKISKLKAEQANYSIKKAYRSYIPSLTAEAGYTLINQDIVFPEDLQTLLQATQWLLIKESANLPFNQAATPQLLEMLAQKGVTIKETPPIQERNIWNANLTAQMVIFSGGQIPFSIKAASHQQKSYELLSEQETSDLSVEVISYYDKFAVVTQSENVLQQTQNFLDEQARFVEKAYKNGLATELDLQKIELAKQQLENKKIELITSKKLIAAKLSQLSGIESERLINSKIKLEVLKIEIVESEIKNRKDLQALEQAIMATDYKQKSEFSSYMPKIVAFGKKELVTDELSIFDPEWAVGVKLKWNLFDGFTSSTKVQQIKIDKLILEEQRNHAIELLELKLEKDKLELEKSEQMIKVADKKVLLAQKLFELSKKQYEQGLITQNEHLNSVNELEKAQLEQIEAIYNQRIAAISFLETSGIFDYKSIL